MRKKRTKNIFYKNPDHILVWNMWNTFRLHFVLHADLMLIPGVNGAIDSGLV